MPSMIEFVARSIKRDAPTKLGFAVLMVTMKPFLFLKMVCNY